MAALNDTAPCPCQSGSTYGGCCAPYHRFSDTAPTPLTLMRSRYSAYLLNLKTYLLQTWSPQTRPVALPDNGLQWFGLEIINAPDPEKTKTPDKGSVHFKAIYQDLNQWGYLEEDSLFERIEGKWFYLDGKIKEGPLKPKRNERCPCGSSKKFKTCCGKD